MKIKFSSRDSHSRQKQLLMGGSKSKSRWPPGNELRGIFSGLFLIMSCQMIFSFNIHIYTLSHTQSRYTCYIYCNYYVVPFHVVCEFWVCEWVGLIIFTFSYALSCVFFFLFVLLYCNYQFLYKLLILHIMFFILLPLINLFVS